MAKRKISCERLGCKYHGQDNSCLASRIKVSAYGCETFEKGFVYYFQKVWSAMENSNMISCNRLDEDLKIGLVYVMKTFGLHYSINEWGTWRFVNLYANEDKEHKTPLSGDDIRKREIIQDEMNKLYADFKNGILPKAEEQEKPKKESQPYGWLSPTGVFTEGEWGDHEKVAQDIIKQKGWTKELLQEDPKCYSGDFLTKYKGYVLIHSPANDGYIVTHQKELTKAQREFLYGYFIDMGDRWKAELYLEE